MTIPTIEILSLTLINLRVYYASIGGHNDRTSVLAIERPHTNSQLEHNFLDYQVIHLLLSNW
jgi:hypothetical protein